MKLAELLVHKKDLEAAFAQLTMRLQSGAHKYEGEEEIDNIKVTIDQIFQMSEDLKQIRLMINALNFKTTVNNENSLQYLIFSRDTAKQLFASFTQFANNLEARQQRWNETEKKLIRTYDVHEARKMRDKYAEEWRNLDLLIQQTNWAVEVPMKQSESKASSEGEPLTT